MIPACWMRVLAPTRSPLAPSLEPTMLSGGHNRDGDALGRERFCERHRDRSTERIDQRDRTRPHGGQLLEGFRRIQPPNRVVNRIRRRPRSTTGGKNNQLAPTTCVTQVLRVDRHPGSHRHAATTAFVLEPLREECEPASAATSRKSSDHAAKTR